MKRSVLGFRTARRPGEFTVFATENVEKRPDPTPVQIQLKTAESSICLSNYHGFISAQTEKSFFVCPRAIALFRWRRVRTDAFRCSRSAIAFAPTATARSLHFSILGLAPLAKSSPAESIGSLASGNVAPAVPAHLPPHALLQFRAR
jgi:hypothetical protein